VSGGDQAKDLKLSRWLLRKPFATFSAITFLFA